MDSEANRQKRMDNKMVFNLNTDNFKD